MKPATVVGVHAPFETERYYIINGKVRITETHPVLSGGKWVDVTDLKVGDSLTDLTGRAIRILSIVEVDEVAPTYNFKVSGGLCGQWDHRSQQGQLLSVPAISGSKLG